MSATWRITPCHADDANLHWAYPPYNAYNVPLRRQTASHQPILYQGSTVWERWACSRSRIFKSADVRSRPSSLHLAKLVTENVAQASFDVAFVKGLLLYQRYSFNMILYR